MCVCVCTGKQTLILCVCVVDCRVYNTFVLIRYFLAGLRFLSRPVFWLIVVLYFISNSICRILLWSLRATMYDDDTTRRCWLVVTTVTKLVTTVTKLVTTVTKIVTTVTKIVTLFVATRRCWKWKGWCWWWWRDEATEMVCEIFLLVSFFPFLAFLRF